MKIFAIADLHLALNEKIDKPMDIFGDGWENHVGRLEEHWHSLVSEDNVVLVPGDISWALRLDDAMADLDWIHSLPGRKVLLKGNHDLWWIRINYLNTLYDDMKFLQNDCYYIEEADTAICGARGWVIPGDDEFEEHDKKIYVRDLGRLENSLRAAEKTGAKTLIAMTHYPPAITAIPDTEVTSLLESYRVRTCVYGHLHGMNVFGKGIKGEHNGVDYRLVSLDYLGAKPLLIYDTEQME